VGGGGGAQEAAGIREFLVQNLASGFADEGLAVAFEGFVAGAGGGVDVALLLHC
jgi:hypothetical protein